MVYRRERFPSTLAATTALALDPSDEQVAGQMGKSLAALAIQRDQAAGN
jgi:hypothetical protein